MNSLTKEQSAAVESCGKVIVSASAGSGKTFVMIEKLVKAIAGGADLDEILAVTFTKKAAAQMKEKLRSALIARMDGADEETKTKLKIQLSKISSADISTIHSLCARLIRTYFYVLDADAGFDIISADDATAKDLKSRAMDALFDRLYEEDSKDFKLLLSCFVKKRSDNSLRKLVLEAYNAVRSCAHYEIVLENAENLYTEKGFNLVCGEYGKILSNKFKRLIYAVQSFKNGFVISKNADVYNIIFDEMLSALETCANGGLFVEKPPIVSTKKPVSRAGDSMADRIASDNFKAFKDEISKKYKSLCSDLENAENERKYFFESGKIAVAFSRLLLQFDTEYTAVKRDENKLDYNDLEHLTLKLLADERVRGEINSTYKYVFVDEYQDVNPVQEEIISGLGREVFLVGDVKQAIYGFRGSRSQFFADKFKDFSRGAGSALKLSNNFRSSDGVLYFVNAVFSDIMRLDTCGIDYANDGVMLAGGGYPENYGDAHIHIYGKDDKEERELKIYSVADDSRQTKHTREGLAVLAIVESELKKSRYDLKEKKFVPVQAGDICILTRKNKGASTEGIVRALRDEGYSVAGEQQPNICALPEVKQFLDVLSLIDNAEQDIPLVSALLSPLGGLCEDELANIRITLKDKKNLSFRACCREYCAKMRTEIARKIGEFYQRLEKLRALSEIADTGEIANELLENYGLETAYGAGGGAKLKNVLKLIGEGANLTLSAFLEKIKTGGYEVSAPASSASDSIKIMTMHAAKGLEFPVVIIADICKTFKGADYSEAPFDELYGFAPKYFDIENRLTHKTVLRRLAAVRSDAEELKNEMNLFYVACTRAMCSLHILAEEIKPFSAYDVSDARCYADLFDIGKFFPEALAPNGEIVADTGENTLVYRPDSKLVEKIEKRFSKPYAYETSIDLPVKSSASAILKMRDFEPYYETNQLFGGEGETGTERGTAYHRFLELCDFSLKSVEEIKSEIENFLVSGRITDGQRALLNAEGLAEILQMPVFENLSGARLFREQEFLCRLRANEILPGVSANDWVLVQGAIDLLAECSDCVKIIDYKYSHKSDEQLIKTYKAQLDLYKKAVAVITGNSFDKISCTIVNIFARRQIDL